MSETEKVVWVDENNAIRGFVPRSIAHDKNNLLLHRESMTMVRPRGDNKHFWLQKRSHNKTQFPDKWTLAVTCHVNEEDISENDPLGYITASKREGREEIHAELLNLILLKVVLIENEKNRAMAGIVLAEIEGIPEPSLDEVAEVKLFDKETVREIINELTPAALFCLRELEII